MITTEQQRDAVGLVRHLEEENRMQAILAEHKRKYAEGGRYAVVFDAKKRLWEQFIEWEMSDEFYIRWISRTPEGEGE